MLSELHYPFSLIGLTETKIKSGHDPVISCELPGYCFVSQPSYSHAGSIGFLIRNEIECTPSTDLSSVKKNLRFYGLRCKNMTRVICCVVLYIDI